MFDVLVVGHSLADPDLRLVLEIAKESASPDHPIFMISAAVTKAEERELFTKYNIVLQSYDNSDGKHTELKRILMILSRFVKGRRGRLDLPPVMYSADEVEAAQAMAIYRRLESLRHEAPVSQFLGPLVLATLDRADDHHLEADRLLTSPPLSTAEGVAAVSDMIGPVIDDLRNSGLIENDAAGYRLTAASEQTVHQIQAEKALEENQAFGQFVTILRAAYPALKTAEGIQRGQP